MQMNKRTFLKLLLIALLPSKISIFNPFKFEIIKKKINNEYWILNREDI
tara:strand:- start:346 stop:492 length:147 start_codon:yes stop_codon:yes gene_type:complete